MQVSGPVAIGSGLAVAALLAGAVSAENTLLWWAGAAAIMGAGCLLMKEGSDSPPLILLLLMYWITIVFDLLNADIQGVSIEGLGGGVFRSEAVLLSFTAMLAISIGMKVGFRRASTNKRIFSAQDELNISIPSALALYFGATLFSMGLAVVATSVQALVQPVNAFGAIRLATLFILVRRLRRTPNGIVLMVGLMLLEGVIGISSYIASFQPAFITIIAATMSTSGLHKIRALDILAGLAGFILLLYIAIFWTAVKPEFRSYLAGGDTTTNDRLDWIAEAMIAKDIDYWNAFSALLSRIGYTKFYGIALERQYAGVIPPTQFWLFGVENVLMPRVLFPDKAALNDTYITTLLTGVEFNASTSVSVGYTAEANIDFGAPLMFLPLLGLGVILGATARYFISARGPEIVNSSFCAAALCATFKYEENIDKGIGGFMLTVTALAILFHFRNNFMPFIFKRKLSEHQILLAN